MTKDLNKHFHIADWKDFFKSVGCPQCNGCMRRFLSHHVCPPMGGQNHFGRTRTLHHNRFRNVNGTVFTCHIESKATTEIQNLPASKPSQQDAICKALEQWRQQQTPHQRTHCDPESVGPCAQRAHVAGVLAGHQILSLWRWTSQMFHTIVL